MYKNCRKDFERNIFSFFKPPLNTFFGYLWTFITCEIQGRESASSSENSGHPRFVDTNMVTGYTRRERRGGGIRESSHAYTGERRAHIGARPTANSFAGSQQERIVADIHSVSANLTEGEHHTYI